MLDFDERVAEWYRAASARCTSHTTAHEKVDHCAPCKHTDANGWPIVHPLASREKLPNGMYCCRDCDDKPYWTCTARGLWNHTKSGREACGMCGKPRGFRVVQAPAGGSSRSGASEDAMLRVAGFPIGTAMAEMERDATLEQRRALKVYLSHAVDGASFALIADACARLDMGGDAPSGFPSPTGCGWTVEAVASCVRSTRDALRKRLRVRAPTRREIRERTETQTCRKNS
jgi:hypothetical protein